MEVHEIDAHIDTHEATEFKASASFDEQQLKLFNICTAYQKVRPIIKFVRGLLFWKPKWQAVVDEFVAAADGICPAP